MKRGDGNGPPRNRRTPETAGNPQPPTRIRHTVLTFNALTGKVIGPKPKGPCMVVPHFGTDEEWSEQLQAQQSRLILSAGIQEEAQSERHLQ